jgi:VanZ family protein
LYRVTRLGAAILLAALVSLAMELVQAWLPSRDSSAFDFMLNISGTGLGVLSTFGLGLSAAPRNTD